MVTVDYINKKYVLSCNNPKVTNTPSEILLKSYDSLGDVLKILFKYDNEYRAQLECSP